MDAVCELAAEPGKPGHRRVDRAQSVRALDLATGRSRVVYTPAGQPDLVTADPAVGHMLLQIQQRGTPTVTLARLDLATGRVTYLPSAWTGPLGAGHHVVRRRA